MNIQMQDAQVPWLHRSLPIDIPELTVAPDYIQLFMFSAVTWNCHHIHYSKEAAKAEGLPGLAIHRSLIGNYFSRCLTNWLGDHGQVSRLAWKVINSAVAGTPLTCRGQVVKFDPESLDLTAMSELVMMDDRERLIATCVAHIRANGL